MSFRPAIQHALRPLPETQDAPLEMAAGGDTSAGIHLFTLARRIRQVVPELVGLSVTRLEEEITFTVVASDEQAAALDAVQYLDDGPCESSVENGRLVEGVVDDMLDEGEWGMYARASAASGVASSLSLPVMRDGRAIGSVNLYGATPDAFDGRHGEIAQAVGSTAEDAIVNADLSFQTAGEAMLAPERVRESREVNIAMGIIAANQDVSIPVARVRLREAAARAGITEAQAARAIQYSWA